MDKASMDIGLTHMRRSFGPLLTAVCLILVERAWGEVEPYIGQSLPAPGRLGFCGQR
jgi:hypothetical protein